MQQFAKRSLDLALAALGLAMLWWLLLLVALLARVDTGASGVFRQQRVGRCGRRFDLLKIRTMRHSSRVLTVVTTSDDPRITRLGGVLRRTKLDELPQLYNILKGDMSFVGPRPDVPEYMDRLSREDRIILSVRPGITGPASLKYRDEEKMLARQSDPERFNRDVIFPDKIRINRRYVENYSFAADIRYILATVFPRIGT